MRARWVRSMLARGDQREPRWRVPASCSSAPVQGAANPRDVVCRGFQPPARRAWRWCRLTEDREAGSSLRIMFGARSGPSRRRSVARSTAFGVATCLLVAACTSSSGVTQESSNSTPSTMNRTTEPPDSTDNPRWTPTVNDGSSTPIVAPDPDGLPALADIDPAITSGHARQRTAVPDPPERQPWCPRRNAAEHRRGLSTPRV